MSHSSKPSAATNTKAKPFSLRLTQEERQYLEDRAGRRPLGDYIRHKLFGDKVTMRKQKQTRQRMDFALIGKALASMGQSRLSEHMEELVMASRSGRLKLSPAFEKQLMQSLDDINFMRDSLIEALGIKAEKP